MDVRVTFDLDNEDVPPPMTFRIVWKVVTSRELTGGDSPVSLQNGGAWWMVLGARDAILIEGSITRGGECLIAAELHESAVLLGMSIGR